MEHSGINLSREFIDIDEYIGWVKNYIQPGYWYEYFNNHESKIFKLLYLNNFEDFKELFTLYRINDILQVLNNNVEFYIDNNKIHELILMIKNLRLYVIGVNGDINSFKQLSPLFLTIKRNTSQYIANKVQSKLGMIIDNENPMSSS